MRIAEIMALVVPPVTELVRRAHDAGGGTQPAQPMFPTLVAVRNQRVVATFSSPRVGITLTGATTMAVGLAPEALVLAAQGRVEDRPVISYTVMTRDREAAAGVQDVTETATGVTFGVPQRAGEPDETAMRVLAEAMGQQPIDVSRVARQDHRGTFGEQPFLPPERGRVVVDAGTVKTLQERVQGVAGRALYLARSQEAGRLALEAGLPRACLLQPQDQG